MTVVYRCLWRVPCASRAGDLGLKESGLSFYTSCVFREGCRGVSTTKGNVNVTELIEWSRKAPRSWRALIPFWDCLLSTLVRSTTYYMERCFICKLLKDVYSRDISKIVKSLQSSVTTESVYV